MQSEIVENTFKSPRKVWFKTYGCQMNSHDTERMLNHLRSLNFTQSQSPEDADLLVFNSCAVRDLANQKFYSHLGETKKIKKTKKEVKVAVGGCVAQTEAKELLKKYPQIDFAFGTDVIDNINEMVVKAFTGEERFQLTKWDKDDDYSIETKITHNNPQAFVNIIKGCDKFCSYCIVPFTRGRERSRKTAEVVEDVRKLVKYSGVQEVTLLGQNVNSFGKERGETFASLLRQLNEVDGLEIIRYTTSHPYDMSDELIAAHRDCKKLANHVHLPVQSGSNSVLQRMLREYTVEHYLGLLEKLREANPALTISTDIIAGFPNETDREHEATLRLLEQAKFDFIYAYKYSPRRGTKAARMEDRLSEEVRKRRLHEIQQKQLELQYQNRAGLEGETLRVLVEGQSQLHGEKKWKGRSSCYRIVHIDDVPVESRNLLWHWVDVKINQVTALACRGKIVSDLGRRPGL